MSATEYFIVLKSPHGSDYAMFWRANHCGYTRRINEAGRYSKDEAERICKLRGEEVMVPCGEIEEHAVRVVNFETALSFAEKQ